MKRKFFVVAAVMISSLLQAQQIPFEDSTISLLDEVILTANKYPNKTSLTGKVITVINQGPIREKRG